MLEGAPSAPSICQRIALSEATTLGVGGEARYLVEVHSRIELDQGWEWAQRLGLPTLFLGEGSNVLAPDAGFPGVVLRNRIVGRERAGDEVAVGGGENLPALIRWLNSEGLAGMENMYGIPGTVAGAVVGNAGAYGQEIQERLIDVDVWSPKGVFTLPVAELNLGYRHSVFKERRDWFVLGCRLRLRAETRNLQALSDAILEKRLLKYPVGLRCPGSFFKNVVAQDLEPEVLRRLPSDFVVYGKIPAGKLLEAVGANGTRRGDARFAPYHGNLLMNVGQASQAEILSLAREYADKVFERFGIRLEAEVLIVD